MTHEIANWVDDAISRMALEGFRVTEPRATEIYSTAQYRFVEGCPRVWWDALKVPYEIFDSKFVDLSEVIPRTSSSCWLVPETGLEITVYSVKCSDVPSIIRECPYFEYYVVDGEYRWMIAESDHNQLFVCRGQRL